MIRSTLDSSSRSCHGPYVHVRLLVTWREPAGSSSRKCLRSAGARMTKVGQTLPQAALGEQG